MHRPVYLDHHATTPVDPRVVDAMLPYFGERFGNAASPHHSFGARAREAVERARRIVAGALGVRDDEIVFTSGATESNNAAIRGVAESAVGGRDHFVTAATEHPSVLDPLERLARRGFRVSVLPVDHRGRLDPADVADAITDRTLLVTVMAANNEVGTLHRIAEIGAIARRRGVLFHTDAVQAFGKVPLDLGRVHVDLASLTAHKMHGPKGVGALFVRGGVRERLSPLILGGGHEGGLRSGTQNVPGVVGFAEAVRIAEASRDADSRRLGRMRDRLEALLTDLEGVEVNGDRESRLPHNLNVSFAGVDGESVLLAIDDVALSTGSACASAGGEPSHVLRAMGLGEERVKGSVRIGLGRFNTEDEIEYVGRRLVEAVVRLRRLAPARRS